MIRITSSEHDSETIISMAGRLEMEHLKLVEQIATETKKDLVLDLSNLQSADRESLDWLRHQIERGVRVTGTSPYIAMRIQKTPDSTLG